MSVKLKFIILIILSVITIIVSVAAGSVYVSLSDISKIIAGGFTGSQTPSGIPGSYPPLILDIRIPRVFLAFITGAALAISGAVMQSILQNPLASPFGLGVSSGAGLGAALAMILGIAFLVQAFSLAFALAAVFLTAALAARLDRSFSNASIVLIGMVISLFCTALMSLEAAFNPDYAQRIQLWQLGSLSMKDKTAYLALLPVTAAALIFFLCFSRELDIMAYGEDQAAALGVNVRRTKVILLLAVAVLTGVSVSFVGIIGFVDLAVPFITRKIVGASHKRLLIASALIGGIFLTLCDLAARTLAQPREIPIGVITALLGAPFFLYIFFAGRRRANG